MSKKFYVFIPIFLILVIIFSSFSYLITTSEEISDNIFRLHILANSDSDEDQHLKLKVRDEILNTTSTLFSNANSLENAKNIANENISLLYNIASNVIKDNGYNYDLSISIKNEYFNTRDYTDFVMPAGFYDSIIITIGNGEGHNWWCVIYPSVCISGCTDDFDKALTEEEKDLISNYKFYPKFKIIELYEEIKNKIMS